MPIFVEFLYAAGFAVVTALALFAVLFVFIWILSVLGKDGPDIFGFYDDR